MFYFISFLLGFCVAYIFRVKLESILEKIPTTEEVEEEFEEVFVPRYVFTDSDFIMDDKGNLIPHPYVVIDLAKEIGLNITNVEALETGWNVDTKYTNVFNDNEQVVGSRFLSFNLFTEEDMNDDDDKATTKIMYYTFVNIWNTFFKLYPGELPYEASYFLDSLNMEDINGYIYGDD